MSVKEPLASRLPKSLNSKQKLVQFTHNLVALKSLIQYVKNSKVTFNLLIWSDHKIM